MREADYFPTHPRVDPKNNMRGGASCPVFSR